MIRYARTQIDRASRGARLFVARFDSFSARVADGSIGLAVCPINSIRHVRSDREMVRHLRAVRRALHPCGVYAVGISLSAYGLEAPTEDVWVGRRKGLSVRQVITYTPAKGGRRARERAEAVHSLLEIRSRAGVEMRSDRYALHAYSRAEWLRVIRASGLVVLEIVDEDGRPFEPGLIGYGVWVLSRPDHPLFEKNRHRPALWNLRALR
jgi:hypothetical protein